jgi:hypothetical protein
LAKAAVLLSCKKTTPLDQSSGAGLLKMSAVYVATILIEVVKDGSVNGAKFLQTSHLPEPLHRPLLSSEGLVLVLCSVVQPTPCFLLGRAAQFPQGGAIGP